MAAVAFLLLLVVGVPVGIILCVSALVYIFSSGNLLLLDSYPLQLFNALNNFGLLAIPLFILIGELMNGAGITQRLVRLAAAFLGALRGGLAYINLVANMMVASILGSATAQIAMMSQVMVPEMEKEGYRRDFSTAVTAFGGLLGPIIPPSIVFVVYAVLAQLAVRDMLLAGLLPGLMLTALFLGTIAILGTWHKYPRGQKLSWAKKRAAFGRALPMLSIPAIIIGTILGGFGSPTEAASLGALAAFGIGLFVTGTLKLSDLPHILLRTGINSALVLFLVASAGVFSWVLVFGQVPQTAAAWIQTVATTPAAFMLLVLIVLLLVGTVIDGIAGLIMVVPILLPIATEVYGIHPVHFGVVVSINLILGLLSPPVGIGLYVAANVAKVSPLAVFRVAMPFFVVTCLALLVLALVPSISLAFL
ncbi:TRAP transporter large permease subunit [Roseobacter sp. HKCCD9010]|uniref:TRAP transporter large permease n=1 Tax=unclassified Roseobacter TaxID=196798 RepID=UPI0014920BA6|nr:MULTISPECIES: TRAP transporter large permease [unclassified Roseobacter]MBF9052330.1 TRAP transporter large permease subunit [Rhodobacterales bacterium HKCCD4356]NNV14395.1 TRAP transporter large permease subunit [Roseobacter sp. HKCCD7357]NNV18641.1 TRAP transporter large permease subunit [Roseobacter sp. HKCCD8768]NNV28088.1 TRAP transporter large permease subunit [Roseobacter sp. HKCCD8192]NNV32317.1 TRAP transporter large permease subunit [Roseobacter sp. HKCCD9061]